MIEKIDDFSEEYYFLSNFYLAKVEYKGIIYPHNEAAFQAQKTHDKKVRKIFSYLTPNDAKYLGRNIRLRSDWNEIKDNIMFEICYAKFTQNWELKKKLLDTDDAILIEGNTWHDKYWGVYKNEGQNKLGKILMKIREQLKEG
ncbi:MAG: swarming motility protein YbiA [Methanosphaera sp. rholeuAM6]|nr:MAG: swarming motility protein YbiA [Methanosphaera sp. rholeuAM6]